MEGAMMRPIEFTAIEGIRVGHAEDLEAATGCTVVISEAGATAGVDVRGGAPGTRETDLLNPVNLVQKVHAILLAGGSAVQGEDFSKQAAMLEKATETVMTLVKELRRGLHLEQVKEKNDKLQAIEGEADKLMLDLLRRLYNGECETLKVIVLKDLYELLEKAFDRCRDAGNIVFNIVLKLT